VRWEWSLLFGYSTDAARIAVTALLKGTFKLE
jgi:hypothetical protein